MAKIEVEREPVIPQPPPAVTRVTLHLTEEEAVAVASSLGSARARNPGYSVYSVLIGEGLAVGHPRYAEIKRQQFGH